jgi:hypothetical protein
MRMGQERPPLWKWMVFRGRRYEVISLSTNPVIARNDAKRLRQMRIVTGVAIAKRIKRGITFYLVGARRRERKY